MACKVRVNSAADVLAPFGGEQKCRAVGGDTHEEADRVLAVEGLGKLKEMAVNVSQRLSDSEAVSWSSSGRSSLKASVALWLEAADLLNVLVARHVSIVWFVFLVCELCECDFSEETLPLRLGKNAGEFELAARRAAETDLKHWRRRPDSRKQRLPGFARVHKWSWLRSRALRIRLPKPNMRPRRRLH